MSSRLDRRPSRGRVPSRAALLLACLLALVAAGCGGSSSSGSDEPATAGDPTATETDTLDVVTFRAHASSGFLAAQDSGVAGRYGVELTPRFVESSAAGVAQVVSGDAQVGYSSYFGVIDAVRQGVELRVVAEEQRSVPGAITLEVLPDSPIRELADLEGKKVSTPSVNSSIDIKLKAAMEDAGLDSDSVEFVELPYGEVPPAIERGTVDAGTVIGVPQLQAKEELDTRTVFDYGADRFDGFAEGGWIVRADFAEQNPNAVAAYQCSVAAGQQGVIDDEQLYEAMLSKYLGFNEEALETKPPTNFQTSLRPDKLQENADLMEQLELIDEPFDMASITIPAPDDCPEGGVQDGGGEQ